LKVGRGNELGKGKMARPAGSPEKKKEKKTGKTERFATGKSTKREKRLCSLQNKTSVLTMQVITKKTAKKFPLTPRENLSSSHGVRNNQGFTKG